ncbi:MAG: DNA adenine methylase [Candidatus Goldbacteria bacterium]|nr:DNA adenine methylase [Candidatus Goldiibacteriota bacterium]
MKPLIKWAGGKSSEIIHVEEMIPEFKKYIEPFFGGGALYFDLEPDNAVINDISDELISFYKMIKDSSLREAFKEELYKYVEAWEKIDVYLEEFGDAILQQYTKYKKDDIDIDELEKAIGKLFKNKIVPFNGLFKKDFCIDQSSLLEKMETNLISKLERTKEKVNKKNSFSDSEISKNIESALRSGLYMHFRSIFNEAKKKTISIINAKKIANWYFIREFCYGGMFRFNSKGEFNVPYGGIAYNKKDLRSKVDYLFSDEIKNLLSNSKIYSKDFETLFKDINPTKNDFIFLDPPYDSEFSEYEENAFTKYDQERLAKLLYTCKAQWILVIKETPFIKGLYTGHKGIKIKKFSKSYLFNIKERNERKVLHLIIHNL